uniref:Uncharacterized protein n=1 Tax=Columba livia TaxID=8932 RepID=R7VQ09_COLLI
MGPLCWPNQVPFCSWWPWDHCAGPTRHQMLVLGDMSHSVLGGHWDHCAGPTESHSVLGGHGTILGPHPTAKTSPQRLRLTRHGHAIDVDLLDEAHSGHCGLHLRRGHVLAFPTGEEKGQRCEGIFRLAGDTIPPPPSNTQVR